jgi:predicted nucleic acid-binding protein
MILPLVPATLFADIAWSLASETGLTFYDSIYLALAVRGKCKLVTADVRSLEMASARGFGHAVRNLGA